ncbi:MAG TPA: ABC transporter ATP-binding protein [Candidatus Ruania gallistercoris]|uniref:ABC transporter ATP-binding protein n=1 Tax=Candidatus Ruania gallistercoris TaxID=2838746 RepID=A0A9D2EBF1_9MICO|nr:ABC transporter ATP-binding protein [Candidatus Ruania gallistercoris]
MSTPPSNPPAVQLAGVTKQFRTADGPVVAVNGIDLDVPRGQIMAFLGPNGAGKTTALDMVLGLTEPTAGTVLVHGQPPRQAVRAGRISAVLQSGGLLRDLSVAETVRMIASTFEHPMPLDEVLAKAGLTQLAGRKVSKCSGGEQQRLRFALALLPDPDLLILDEPTAGMDVTARREFWDTMRADADSGRTVIFATHYLEEADAFAQRIVMMAAGKIVADGTTTEIRARASGRTVSARLDEAGTQAALAQLRSTPGVHSVTAESGRVQVHASDSDAIALTLLTELGGTELEISSGSLDQAFVALTSTGGSNGTSPSASTEASTAPEGSLR